jgi:1,4-dihydroxy-2-naphthoate octaprenyltransferase
VLGIASILAALAYTGGPFPLGYHGLGEVAVALFFGGVGVLGTVYLQLDELPKASYVAAIAVAALASAILVVNNLRDLNTDRAAGKHTLAVRFGEAGTLLEYRLLLIAPFVIPVVMTAIDWKHVGWFVTWLLIPKAYSVAQKVAVTRGPGLNPLLGATAQLGLRYSLLLAGGIVLERWL